VSNDASAGTGGKYDEILSRLDDLLKKANGLTATPITDPSVNVKEIVTIQGRHQDEMRLMSEKRQDDLREQTERYNDQLQAERHRADSEARRAEAGRIDSLLGANTNNVALALNKQEILALAQDKRIAALEQNQYQGVGAAGQRTEGRQQSQWVIGLIIGVAIFLANYLPHLLSGK
jgi:hypothetical protein